MMSAKKEVLTIVGVFLGVLAIVSLAIFGKIHDARTVKLEHTGIVKDIEYHPPSSGFMSSTSSRTVVEFEDGTVLIGKGTPPDGTMIGSEATLKINASGGFMR